MVQMRKILILHFSSKLKGEKTPKTVKIGQFCQNFPKMGENANKCKKQKALVLPPLPCEHSWNGRNSLQLQIPNSYRKMWKVKKNAKKIVGKQLQKLQKNAEITGKLGMSIPPCRFPLRGSFGSRPGPQGGIESRGAFGLQALLCVCIFLKLSFEKLNFDPNMTFGFAIIKPPLQRWHHSEKSRKILVDTANFYQELSILNRKFGGNRRYTSKKRYKIGIWPHLKAAEFVQATQKVCSHQI